MIKVETLTKTEAAVRQKDMKKWSVYISAGLCWYYVRVSEESYLAISKDGLNSLLNPISTTSGAAFYLAPDNVRLVITNKEMLSAEIAEELDEL